MSSTINIANKIITEGLALLPDEAKAEWKTSASDAFIDEAIVNAVGALESKTADAASEGKQEDDLLRQEKYAMLEAYAVQEANRMASTLWRLQLLPEDLEKEYRSLPTMVEIVKPYNEFLEKRNARSNELAEKSNELQNEKKELEIFMGIINGIPVEESEQKYDEFRKTQQQAFAGGR